MKTITYTAYLFDELTWEGKQKAIANHRDINVDHEWWEPIYEDAKNIGLIIHSFDLDRRLECSGHLEMSEVRVALEIVKNHGRDCETYGIAHAFLLKVAAFRKEWKKIVAEDDLIEDDVHYDSLCERFKRNLRCAYADILQADYEYLTSEDAIADTLIANEYHFTENGRLVSV